MKSSIPQIILQENLAIPSICKVFKACTNPKEVWIMLKLLHNGPTRYSVLKTMIETKTTSGLFAYHVRKLRSANFVYCPQPGLYDLTKQGRMISLIIMQLTSPNSPISRVSEVAPLLAEAMVAVREAFRTVESLQVRLPSLKETAQFRLPPITIPEFVGNYEKETARIREKKRQADAGYYEQVMPL